MRTRSAVIGLVSVIWFSAAAGQGIPGEIQTAWNINHDPVTAPYLNPAYLAGVNQTRLAVSYLPLYDAGDYINYFYLARPITSDLTAGICRMEGVVGNIIEVDEYNRIGENTYSDYRCLYVLSVNQTVSDRISVGGSGKLVVRQVADFSDLGWGMDMGLQYRVNSRARFGLCLQNVLLRPKITLASKETVWPTHLWGDLFLQLTPTVSAVIGGGIYDLLAPGDEFIGGWQPGFSPRGLVTMEAADNITVSAGADMKETVLGGAVTHKVFRLTYTGAWHYGTGFNYRTTLDCIFGASRRQMVQKYDEVQELRAPDRKLDAAMRLIKKKQYWQAVRELGRISAAFPDFGGEDVPYYLGHCFEQLDFTEAAEVCYRKLLDKYPATEYKPDLLVKIMRRQYRSGNTAGADSLFRVLADGYGESRQYHEAAYRYGQSLIGRGDAAAAVSYLESVPEASLYYPYARYSLGVLAYGRGEADRTLALFRQVTDAPVRTNAEQYLQVKAMQKTAHLYYELGDLKQAEKAYDRAMSYEYRQDESFIGMAWTLFRLEKYESAIGLMHKFKADFPKSDYGPEANLIIAYCFLVMDYYEDAQDFFNQTITAISDGAGIDYSQAEDIVAEERQRITGFAAAIRADELRLVNSCLAPGEGSGSAEDQRELREMLFVKHQKLESMRRKMTRFGYHLRAEDQHSRIRSEAEYGANAVAQLLREEQIKIMEQHYRKQMENLEDLMDMQEE